MAKLITETVQITFSRLVKSASGDEHSPILDQGIITILESAAQELVEPGIVIEVEKV